jgi:hypothetical protein
VIEPGGVVDALSVTKRDVRNDSRKQDKIVAGFFTANLYTAPPTILDYQIDQGIF